MSLEQLADSTERTDSKVGRSLKQVFAIRNIQKLPVKALSFLNIADNSGENMAVQSPVTFRRLAKAQCLPFVLCAAFLSQPILSQTTESDGYRYTLHEARLDSLDVDPAALDPVQRYVAQGPEVTLVWVSGVEQTVERASIVGGQKQMGLLIPYWDPDLSPADDSGWSLYGRPITYRSFNLSVERGNNDRDVDGQPASHFVLKASPERTASH